MSRISAKLELLRRSQRVMLTPQANIPAPPQQALLRTMPDPDNIPDDLHLPEPWVPLPPTYQTLGPAPPAYKMVVPGSARPPLVLSATTGPSTARDSDGDYLPAGPKFHRPSMLRGPSTLVFVYLSALLSVLGVGMYGYSIVAKKQKKL